MKRNSYKNFYIHNFPKIKILYSFYLSRFLGTTFDFEKLNSFKKDLENFLKKHGRKLLKYIEKYSGFRWKEKEIKIWIFEGWHPSISFPLLLNVYGDKKLAIFALIHELVHNILGDRVVPMKKSGTEDLTEIEAAVQLITKHVAQHFFDEKTLEMLCKECEFDGFYVHIWEREGKLEKICNLNKHPFRYYLKNNKKYGIKLKLR